MSFCGLRALVDAFPDADSLRGEAAVKAVALFDHEEVGSSSAQGALRFLLWCTLWTLPMV